MPAEQRDDWTTITVNRQLFERLDTLCDTYGFSSKNASVETLLTIADAAGIPLSTTADTDVTRELNINDVSQIKGFIFDDGRPGAELVGTGNDRVCIITGTSNASGSAQPLDRSRHTSGVVVCPACGDELLSYELSDSYPAVETGVFNSMTLHCETCDTQRPHYVLFTLEESGAIPDESIAHAMQTYFAKLLVMDNRPAEEFHNRLQTCADLAQTGGWPWLPDPETWLGFTIDELGLGPVTPASYSEFLKRYFRYLLEQVDGVRVKTLEATPPAETSEYFGDEWQLHLETRGSDPAEAATELEALTDNWESVTLSSESIDADTFADYTVVVTLNGLADTDY